ncbi:MAG TPA: hypothetical protein VFI25_05410 [Planctomycetota bacterium]|jgi:hypothetical protein|nr:hypothetical protein [Planctomycetota bacterium]
MAAAAAFPSRPGNVFQGELQQDQFTYLAYARAISERGNGFAYPNPYDDDPKAPVLYSHLYPLLVGWISRATGLSLFHTSYLVRVVAGAALAIALWRFVGVLFEDPRGRRAAFWTSLLAGGFVWVEALRRLFASGGPWTPAGYLEAFESADHTCGWWFPTVFRNFFYAPETLYHALSFRLLYALAAGRAAQACVSLLLLLYAHPFTGLQFAAIAAGWVVAERLDGRRGLPLPALAVAGAGIAAFLYYNLVWLPRSPSHAALLECWRRTGFYADPLPQLWAYAPWLFLFPFGLRAAREPGPGRGPWRLVVLVLLLTAALMNHHWALGKERPFQPLHFSHGYAFLPMALLALRFALRRERVGRALRRAPVLAALLPFLALDNLLFLPGAHSLARQFALPPAQARALERIAAVRPAQTVLASLSRGLLSSLLPAVSPHRAVLGHPFLTPNLQERWERICRAVADKPGALFAAFPGATLLVVSDAEGRSLERLGQVGPDDLLFEEPGTRVYRRPRP